MPLKTIFDFLKKVQYFVYFEFEQHRFIGNLSDKNLSLRPKFCVQFERSKSKSFILFLKEIKL